MGGRNLPMVYKSSDCAIRCGHTGDTQKEYGRVHRLRWRHTNAKIFEELRRKQQRRMGRGQGRRRKIR